MARLTRQQSELLTSAVRSHEYLRRLTDEVADLHRIVFHANERVDWSRVRHSAEQIVIAEIVSRYHGQPEELYYALRRRETSGKSWEAATRELAAAMHSYYTTPLGVVMRQDLFGQDAVFILPDAYEWTERLLGADQPSE